MSASHQDDLWRVFPRTALEFEERFASEEACREIGSRRAGTARSLVIVVAARKSGPCAAARYTRAPLAAIKPA